MAASSRKRKGPAGKEDFSEHEITQAVVIADNFNDKFSPLTDSRPLVLLPVANGILLEYLLQSLEGSGIEETFLFCCSCSQKIRDYINSSRWSHSDNPMSVTVISSGSFMSLGDVLRELDAKALTRSDFLLINGDVITTLPLVNILEEHRKQRQIDKSCAITLVYRNALPKHKTRCKEDDVLLCIESSNNRIRFYQRIRNTKTLCVPLEIFQNSEEVSVHYDLLDCHISICSPCVPSLFSDNFDYQTLDDLVKGLIINEELLGNSMYIHIAKKGYGASISNFCMYDAVSQDILGRWTYPIVPDMNNLSQFKCHHTRHNIYKETDIEIARNCTLETNVILGSGTKIGDNVFITNSVIGRNCTIGNNVIIKGSYLWDSVVVEDECVLETCVLAEKVKVCRNAKLEPGCILSSEVVIGENTTIPRYTKLQAEAGFGDDSFGEEDIVEDAKLKQIETCDPKLVGKGGRGFLCSSSIESDEETDDSVLDVWGKADNDDLQNDDGDSADSSSSAVLSAHDEHSDNADSPVEDFGEDEDDDTVMFYKEVMDSLQRALEEKVKSENIILEINSSKYAYNVTMKEVNMLVIKAILKMPLQKDNVIISPQQYLVAINTSLTFFHPLMVNYIRSAESQMDCLLSLEEFMLDNVEMAAAVVKALHLLYDKDVLNESIILKWYKSISEEHVKVKERVKPFIQWLQEADEESSED